jgi:hypothetical protein
MAPQAPVPLTIGEAFKLSAYIGLFVLLGAWILFIMTDGPPIGGERRTLVWLLVLIAYAALMRWIMRDVAMQKGPKLSGLFGSVACAGVVVAMGVCAGAGINELQWHSCRGHLTRHCLMKQTELLYRRSGHYAEDALVLGQLEAYRFQLGQPVADGAWLESTDFVHLIAADGDAASVFRLIADNNGTNNAALRLAAAEQFILAPRTRRLAVNYLVSMGTELTSEHYAGIVTGLTGQAEFAALDALLDNTPMTLMERLLACTAACLTPPRDHNAAIGCDTPPLQWEDLSPLANALLASAGQRIAAGDRQGAHSMLRFLAYAPYPATATGVLTMTAPLHGEVQPADDVARRKLVLNRFSTLPPRNQFEIAIHAVTLKLDAGEPQLASMMQAAIAAMFKSGALPAERFMQIMQSLAKEALYEEAERWRRLGVDEHSRSAALKCIALTAAGHGHFMEANRSLARFEEASRKRWAALVLLAAEEAYMHRKKTDLTRYCEQRTTSEACLSLNATIDEVASLERSEKRDDAAAAMRTLTETLASGDRKITELIEAMCAKDAYALSAFNAGEEAPHDCAARRGTLTGTAPTTPAFRATGDSCAPAVPAHALVTLLREHSECMPILVAEHRIEWLLDKIDAVESGQRYPIYLQLMRYLPLAPAVLQADVRTDRIGNDASCALSTRAKS